MLKKKIKKNASLEPITEKIKHVYISDKKNIKK